MGNGKKAFTEKILSKAIWNFYGTNTRNTNWFIEGELINTLHQYGFGDTDGIVLNAGAYTHTSIAISDAIRAINVPVIEVHISNIHAREAYRHTSMIAAACKGSIAGFGMDSYRLAIEALINNK